MNTLEDYTALFRELGEQMDEEQLKEEIRRQIDKELDRPETEINSAFIEAGIDYLNQTDIIRTPVFTKEDIRSKSIKIRSEARRTTAARERKILSGLWKTALAAATAVAVLFFVNYFYIGGTGRCMFNGMFDNLICYAIGYKAPGDAAGIISYETMTADMTDPAAMPMTD